MSLGWITLTNSDNNKLDLLKGFLIFLNLNQKLFKTDLIFIYEKIFPENVFYLKRKTKHKQKLLYFSKVL